jgi:hypothetical protein
MAARASTDRGVGRLASRRTTDREKTKPGCLTARARENPLIYETSYALGSLLLKICRSCGHALLKEAGARSQRAQHENNFRYSNIPNGQLRQ